MKTALVLALSGFVATAPLATTASAASKRGQGFVVFQQDGDEVKQVFDDGKLDGRGCIIGKQAVFDKATGGLKVVPKLKCNFDN